MSAQYEALQMQNNNNNIKKTNSAFFNRNHSLKYLHLNQQVLSLYTKPDIYFELCGKELHCCPKPMKMH